MPAQPVSLLHPASGASRVGDGRRAVRQGVCHAAVNHAVSPAVNP
ncbi:hypothetical protein C7401_11263 [Paraburkholderia unamae]|nr:hypothetical protein C7401_11263 [Paraburkholderia unamae]